MNLFFCGRFGPLFEQIAEQIEILLFGQFFGDVRGHGRELDDLAFVDFRNGKANFAALIVGHDESLSFFTQGQASEYAAVFHRDDGGAKGLIDVAAGVERVFQQAVEAAQADSIEFGANLASIVAKSVAAGTLLLEDNLPGCKIRLGRKKPRAALLEEHADLFILGGKTFEQPVPAGIEVRHTSGTQAFFDGAILE